MHGELRIVVRQSDNVMRTIRIDNPGMISERVAASDRSDHPSSIIDVVRKQIAAISLRQK